MDDLKERLRSGYTPQKNGVMMTWERQCAEAADHIEALEAKLAVAREALELMKGFAKANAYGADHVICYGCADTAERASQALKELDND